MPSKGLTRSGDAYCLSCSGIVDRSDSKCPSCGADLNEEVKAFLCPKCQNVIALGEPQCLKCGLKFKVKSLKPAEPAEDDKFLMKLIEWGKPPEEAKADTDSRNVSGPGIAQPEQRAPSEEQLLKFARLKDSIKELMANRSQMLERMEARIAEEKSRLNQIASMEGRTASAEQVEAEIMSLAAEMADITMLQAHMESLSEDISSLMSSVEIGEAAKSRGLAARALRKQLEVKERELDELRSKEEQLEKREGMVDRKIQAYAAKKKQLDDAEEDLKARLANLEKERAELERLKAIAIGAQTEEEREQARQQWQEEQKLLAVKLSTLHSSVVAHRTGKEPIESEFRTLEGNLDKMMASLEQQIGELISEKVDLQKKISDASMMDEDLKRLLKVLDQMLGQLPENVIERFSKSDEFAVYERILDRFKV